MVGEMKVETPFISWALVGESVPLICKMGGLGFMLSESPSSSLRYRLPMELAQLTQE